MSVSPALPTVDGRLSFADAGRVLAVDPDVRLLDFLLDTWAAAVSSVAVSGDQPAEAARPDEDTPELAVLARKSVLDDALDDFHARSRASGLRDADRLSVSVLEDRQPNSLVVVDETPVAVVDAGEEWVPVGAPPDSERSTTSPGPSPQPTANAGYAGVLESAERYPLRTPSRRALDRAFTDRCSAAVACDLLALLDATATVRRHDPCDQLVRAYLVGARHGVVNYDLRRASEDCGLASPSTLSTVKAELEADGLLETEPVPQPRGRPRQRLDVGVDVLDSAALAELPELVRELRAENRE